MCPIIYMYNHVVDMFLATFPDLTHQHSIKTTIIQLQTGTIGHLTQHYLEHVFVSYNVFFHYSSRDFFCVPSTFSFLLIRLLPVKLKGTISLSLSKPFCYQETTNQVRVFLELF